MIARRLGYRLQILLRALGSLAIQADVDLSGNVRLAADKRQYQRRDDDHKIEARREPPGDGFRYREGFRREIRSIQGHENTLSSIGLRRIRVGSVHSHRYLLSSLLLLRRRVIARSDAPGEMSPRPLLPSQHPTVLSQRSYGAEGGYHKLVTLPYCHIATSPSTLVGACPPYERLAVSPRAPDRPSSMATAPTGHAPTSGGGDSPIATASGPLLRCHTRGEVG